MTRIEHLRTSMLVLALLLAGCAGPRTPATDALPPSEAGMDPEQAGLICPADRPLPGNRVLSAAYNTANACDTARLADACTGAAITRTPASCRTYCAANWWACVGSVRNASTFAGAGCFQDPATNSYHYYCVGVGDCHCL